MIHTNFSSAFRDPTFYPCATAVIAASTALDGWRCILFITLGLIGCVVRSSSGQPQPPADA